jgi:4-hydroxy-tetrahydrodipicolinate reductase
MTDLRIAVVGCAGRMGAMLVREIADTEGCRLAGGIENPGHPALGRDLGELAGIGAVGLEISDDPLPILANSDAVLDFTAPEATAAYSSLAAQARIVHVVGTTGLEAEHEAALAAAGRHTVVVRASNMSLCVNLLFRLVEDVAARLDDAYDIEIVEMHHRHKVDAPSGTALSLGEAAAAGRGVVLDAVAARGRDGITGARRRGDIGFAALRGGDVVGEHTVVFAADGERLELTHRCTDRRTFARGAVRAALWGHGKHPGLYGMAEVLGLSD